MHSLAFKLESFTGGDKKMGFDTLRNYYKISMA
jgi:hypothetical protein